MKRGGFAQPARRGPKQWTGDVAPSQKPRAVLRIVDGKARMSVPVPKESPLRSRTYLRWVASLPCIHCGREKLSQCAHSDEGKGMAIKSSDEHCFPLCATQPDKPGCHDGFGTLGWFSRDQRRTLETTYAAATKAQAIADGKWPKGWPT